MTDLSHWQIAPVTKPVDLRQGPRFDILASAWIVLMDYSQARTVQVTNISAEGARLMVGDWLFLPNTFHLLLQTRADAPNFQVDCGVRWRSGNSVGVEFRQPLGGQILDALGVSKAKPG